MLYLLDANTLITAKNFYYQMKRVPEFWDWLVHQGETGNIKIPVEIYEEFKDTKPKHGKKDELAHWSETKDVSQALLFYALKDRQNRCIVTSEVSKKTLKGARRRIPDVCDDFNIQHIHSYQLVDVLNFSTSWNS